MPAWIRSRASSTASKRFDERRARRSRPAPRTPGPPLGRARACHRSLRATGRALQRRPISLAALARAAQVAAGARRARPRARVLRHRPRRRCAGRDVEEQRRTRRARADGPEARQSHVLASDPRRGARRRRAGVAGRRPYPWRAPAARGPAGLSQSSAIANARLGWLGDALVTHVEDAALDAPHLELAPVVSGISAAPRRCCRAPWAKCSMRHPPRSESYLVDARRSARSSSGTRMGPLRI